MATAKTVLNSNERDAIIHALELYSASLKRSVNTERDVTIRGLREKTMMSVNALIAKCSTGELEL